MALSTEEHDARRIYNALNEWTDLKIWNIFSPSRCRAWRRETRITPSRPQFTPKPRWNDSNQRFQDDTRLYYSGFVTKNPIVAGSLSGKFGVPLRLPESNRQWISSNNTLSSAIIISQWYSGFHDKISDNQRPTHE